MAKVKKSSKSKKSLPLIRKPTYVSGYARRVIAPPLKKKVTVRELLERRKRQTYSSGTVGKKAWYYRGMDWIKENPGLAGAGAGALSAGLLGLHYRKKWVPQAKRYGFYIYLKFAGYAKRAGDMFRSSRQRLAGYIAPKASSYGTVPTDWFN